MNVKDTYPVLYEAYEHFMQTGDHHFTFPPRNKEFYLKTINTIGFLREKGYIDNVSDNLIIDSGMSISIVPTELMSFDITSKGIHFTETGR